MKKHFLKPTLLCVLILCFGSEVFAQLPPTVPIWDANKVTLGLQKISKDIYAIIPTRSNNPSR